MTHFNFMKLARLAGVAALMTMVSSSTARAGEGHWAEALSSPHKFVWLAADPWTPDQRKGVCRVDVDMSQPLKVVLDEASCERTAREPGQVAVDEVRNYVYVPDMSPRSQGVWRLSFDPVQRKLHSPVLLAPHAKLGPHRPSAVALGPDGKLYVSFARTVAVLRLTQPSGDTQGVEYFGMPTRPEGVVGLAFAARTLYIAESQAVSRMGVSGGQALPVPKLSKGRPVAITSDGANILVLTESAAGDSSLVRYKTESNEVETLTLGGTETASLEPTGQRDSRRF